MSISETNTPASTTTSVTATEEKNAPTLAEVVRKYKTKELIDFLRKEEDLELDDDDLKIIEKEKITGRAFLKITEEKLRSIGLGLGPASDLADFAKELGKRKLKSFSSYKTLKDLSDVLRKYGIDSNDIKKIPPFEPEPVKIDDEDEELEQCIKEIKRRMGIIGSATGSNEAVRCEYISPILYASIYIAKRITNKGITMDPQFEVVGDEASGRVDYAIKKVIDVVNEELIAITEGKQKDLVAGFMQNIMQLESSHHTNTRKRKASTAFDDEFDYLYGIVTTASDWYFLMYTPDRVYCSKDDYHIVLTEKIMKDDAELRRGVKKVMEVIVGLLKDRVEVNDSPDSKRARTKKFIKE